MNYSRLQKWLSSFLIFSILFLQTFEIPMLDSTKAEAKVSTDLVSLIVDEDVYGGIVRAKISQYAKNIQAYLPNTRVVIFPVSKTANPFTIASINEKLFYEGDGEGLSRLIGTILIGEVPLPVVHKEGKAFMSVYPYVDFESKSFVYDQTKKLYGYTTKTLTDEKPEIWHSVIRPNTGDESKNQDELVLFFNKTHDFYTKQGLFSRENTKMEPRVFYMDTFHDQESSSPEMWKSYNLYLENIEDIAYNRFNKYLAKKLYDASQGFYSLKSEDITDPAIKQILEANSSSTMDLSNAPDITTKDVIQKSVKQFFEVLNTKYMGDVLRYIHNTGRYGDANNVRADSTPVVIAKKDLFMRTSLKDSNTALEAAIDNMVYSTLAKPMIIGTGYKVTTTSYTASKTSGGSEFGSSNASSGSTLKKDTKERVYKNYFFGQEASTLTNPKQCTIVRGSTLKVESNRGYNVANAEKDIKLLNEDLPNGGCFAWGVAATLSYWGGNSPLNFDQNAIKSGELGLKSHVYKNFVQPIYDVLGSRELGPLSSLHIATPLDCLQNNMLLQPYVDETDNEYGAKTTQGWPPETNGTRFSCVTVHQPLATPFLDYYTYSKNGFPTDDKCTVSILELDGKAVKQSGDFCPEIDGTKNLTKIYSFKTLSGSTMEHKSPTDEEYGMQLKAMVTPSLPSDRDRYVDYLDVQASYKKIVYPNLFRIVLSWAQLNYPGAQAQIKNTLDAKTREMKAMGGNIDLYEILATDDKALNTVIEWVLWNNMKNATLKYSHTLERSLDIDGEKKISADDTKNDYEIAYLGAPGDARNMYLKLDPEAKGPFPKEISDIMDQVNNYHGLIDGTNISNVPAEPEFKCGPPEGVPIWQWLPAIFCWLGTILPPTISGGSCGVKTIGDTTGANSTPSNFTSPANTLDQNKNGVLDGYELIGSPSGELQIQNPEKVFGYNETVPLQALLTQAGKIIDIDDFNTVSFDIKKLAIVSPNSGTAPVVVYDREGSDALANVANINPYINFKPLGVRADHGVANYAFSSKDADINVVFDAHILTKDRYGKVVVDKTATPVTFMIRSLRIGIQSKVKSDNLPFASSSVISAGNSNGILFNLSKINKDQASVAENFPYTLNVYDDITNKTILDPINIAKDDYLFRDTRVLNTAWVYRFEFIDKVGIRGFTTITVLPALPTKIEVTPSSNIFTVWQKTTVLVRVLDGLGNVASGEVYKLSWSVSWGAGFVSSESKEPTSTISTNIIQGYTSFDITNSRASDDIELSFRIDRANVASDTITLRSIDFAKMSVEVADKDNIIVWKEKHKVVLRVLDKDNQVLTGYNGIASLDFPKLSGSFSTPFVHIKNGVSEGDIFLTPGYVAEQNLRIQAQIPGIGSIDWDSVTVLPDAPMSFAFGIESEHIEAWEGNVQNTRATLYDRYGNIAYNTLGYRLMVNIPLESQKYATIGSQTIASSGTTSTKIEDVLETITSLLGPDGVASVTAWITADSTGAALEEIIGQLWDDSSILTASWMTGDNLEDILKSLASTLSIEPRAADNSATSSSVYAFSWGILDFTVRTTALPWKAYIVGTVVPGLESNSFTVTDTSNKTLTITGISQNVTLLDTYYVFNKSKLDQMRYDAQYTTLLGGEYGDVTVAGYLGGEILFNHDSKSLAVTTLLNNPWQNKTLFGFTPAGKYTLGNGTDETDSLDTSIGDNGEKSYISFYDSYRKEYIARAWLNINPEQTSYIPCSSSGSDISACELGPNATVFLKGSGDNTAIRESGGLTLLSANDIPLLRIHRSGKMEKYPGIEIELDDQVVSNLLGMKLVSNGATVGYLGMKFSSDSVEIVSPVDITFALSNNTNALVIEALSSRYTARKTHLGISSKGSEGVMFSFNDSSANSIGTLDETYLAKSGQRGLEDYPNKAGIGWEDTNRMLLEIAAGTTVGNATKFYQTFSTITLGDAVSHLPKIVTQSNFDRTIGMQIATGNGEQIESYKKLDVNADGVPDIVIFYESGKIQLLINYSGSFKDMGYLAYVSDGWKWRKWVGDFFGDDYDDIILSDSKWKLILLDNRDGKFIRSNPTILSESGTLDSIHGYIQQLEIFDMDNDGRDDIVTLDDSWEINILYGDIDGNGAHVFRKHLIENGLGLRLSKEARSDAGAFSYAGLSFPTQNAGLLRDTIDPTADPASLNQEMIDNLIYYEFAYDSSNRVLKNNTNTAIAASIGTNPLTNMTDVAWANSIATSIDQVRALAGPENTDFSALERSERESKKIFIRSIFSEGKGLKVAKSYKLLTAESRDTLQSGDKIQVEIVLTNMGTKAFWNAIYLDSNDHNIFNEDQNGIYAIARNGTGSVQKPLKYLTEGEFDYGFDLGSIAPRETVKIQYLISANPTSYGQMNVGLLEKWETGDDIYGDIALSPNNMCGWDLIMWRSVPPFIPIARTYEKGTKKFVDRSVLPEELKQNTVDMDKNGIPDYIDGLIKSGTGGDITLLQQYSEHELEKYNIDKNGNAIPDRGDSKGSKVVSYDPATGKLQIGGLTSGNIDAINGQIDEVVRWLGCGFGWGGCISTPLNWAPLAPGSTPTLFGFPLGPLTPYTGIPTFSAFTFCGPQSPITWPPCSAGAWGYFGFSPGPFRLFITPTITGAVGVAACFGSNVANGYLPPPGISPLVPGGNCVVAAQPLMSCKDDGSDGDAGSLGLGMDSNNPYVNANACIKSSGWDTALLPEDKKNLIAYVGGDTSRLPEINTSLARGGLSSFSVGPLVGIGTNGGGDSNFDVSIDSAAIKNFDFGSIIKIKNTRVSAFPDFLMEWATRQLEEVVNKLTSLPTLYIILPDFSGFDISGYKDFPNKFAEGKSRDDKNYASSLQVSASGSMSWAKSSYNSLVNDNTDTVNSFGKNISWVKAAYEFMSHLPLIKLENEMVDIAIPWLSFEEMDKWLIDAKLKQKQWQTELASKQEKWSSLGSADGVDKQVLLRTDWLLSTLGENIRIIEEYKRFPEKLQKYLTWKERYASQLLCNIEAIEFMMGGWISDNGKRFRTWVELYILIKAILKGWQAIVDLFTGYEKECATCNNERYDLKHFIFKLISAIIPKIPIIQFPKWPDIWLDLHNIRGGIEILMPEFHFNFVPMILPELPELHLPDVPTLGIGLPSLPILPRLPNLPNLPDLPSLPNIKLPDLPPPPTIPKLFGGIAAVLEIFKIVAKILCIMRTNPFVPEWRAGDQIAQITERQGRLPIDFLNIEFPNFSLSFIDAIKVSTFVNLELDIDFIVAMSRATLDPLNRFTNDFSNLGAIKIPNVNLQNTVPTNVEVTVGKPESYNDIKNQKPTKNEMMTYLFGKLSFEIVKNFAALNQYMQKHATEEVTVQGLRDILTENIGLIRNMNDPKALAIADSLQKAVTYPGHSETKFIQELSIQNTEKFRLLKDYVKGEQTETTRLKTELDMMLRTGIIEQKTTPSLLSIGAENIKTQALSTESGFGDDIKQKILATNKKILPSLERVKNGGPDSQAIEIQDIGTDLVSGVKKGLDSFSRDLKNNDETHRLAYSDSMSTLLSLSSTDAATPSISTASLSSSTSDSSSALDPTYQYEGIYILDKNEKQIRLFDYVDGVDGTEELVYLDMDKDGDDDILYRMDNSLYLKKNYDKTPAPIYISDSPRVLSFSDFLERDSVTWDILAAPNHFEETFTTSNEINFSFEPSNSLSDNLMRFEYYDYIDRFDKIHSGENSLSITPETLIHKVDLIPDLSTETTTDTSQTWFVGRKNIISFGRGSWEASVTMGSYQYITEETNGTSNPIIIAEGRTVYTDAGGATISYVLDGETVEHTLNFAPKTNYEFLKNTKISVLSGKLYLFKTSEKQKTVNAGDLFGMPVLPDTQVEITSQNSYVSFSYFDGSSMTLDGPGTYQYYPLGKKKPEYDVSISASNDWYYAKLYSIHGGRMSTIASLHLLSPQKEADTQWPLITYSDVIRIPVYQQQLLNLNSSIEDISSIDNVWMDMDLTKDTDGNGDPRDDKDTLDMSNPYGVKKWNTLYDFSIGPFDTLFTKKTRLYTEDGNGNISSKDITLTVYAPVPTIQSLSGTVVSWDLNEALAWEPIDIFRLRNGVLARIELNTIDSSKTKLDGTFDLLTKGANGIVLTQSGKTIATIDERTGKISLEDTSFQIQVISATKDTPMQIQILSPSKQVIYTEKIDISSVFHLESTPNLDTASGTGVFVSPNTWFSFVQNAFSSQTLPSGGYITDVNHKAVAGISKSGDIYILDSKYQLSYAVKDSYILLRLKNTTGDIAANILYKINAEYIIK